MEAKKSTVGKITEFLTVDEIAALLKYASERSLDRECVVTTPLFLVLQEFEWLTKNTDPTNRDTKLDEVSAQIACLYGRLCTITSPVTGNTLLETNERFDRSVRPLQSFTLLFLVLAIGNEALKAWLTDTPEPEDGWLLGLMDFRRYILDYCAPFFWGALGSMAYLLKKLSDIADERSFDSARAHGWITRIFLGAMLGGIVQFIYDPTVFAGGAAGFKMSAIALGFLTGLGVKVVYGAIEKTIDVLASKMNLDAIRKTKNELSSVQLFLNEQLSKTDKEHDAEKRRAILALLNDLQDPTKLK